MFSEQKLMLPLQKHSIFALHI